MSVEFMEKYLCLTANWYHEGQGRRTDSVLSHNQIVPMTSSFPLKHQTSRCNGVFPGQKWRHLHRLLLDQRVLLGRLPCMFKLRIQLYRNTLGTVRKGNVCLTMILMWEVSMRSGSFQTVEVLPGSELSETASGSGVQQARSCFPKLFWANLKYIMWPIATKDTEISTNKPKASGLGAKMTMMKCSRSRR